MVQSQSSPCSYQNVLARFNEHDLHLIAQIKRFMECLSGDSEFRKRLEADPADREIHERLRAIGVEVKGEDFIPLWSQPEWFTAYLQWLVEPTTIAQPELNFDLNGWPLLQLWTEWMQANGSYFKTRASSSPADVAEPRFDAWRKRRVASAKSELGAFAYRVDHSLFAFELSRGCSMGCWFCGLSAEKLSGIFEYTPEHRSLWRKIVQTSFELFGAAIDGTICYHGTEPYDNPYYLEFLKDYQKITGKYPRTTTAAPLKDPDWIRSLIHFYRQGEETGLRLSVLNVTTLRRIHETYTPDELRDVSFEMQMKHSLLGKVASGRLLEANQEKLYGPVSLNPTSSIPQGSLGCITGFLVNMVEKNIQLISPCYANQRWPQGYRLFGKETFSNANDYRNALERLIERHMFENTVPDMPLAFRDDLQCTIHSDGFTLVSPNHKHHVKGHEGHRMLGELLHQGGRTYQDISRILAQSGTASAGDAWRIVTKLFNRGLLNELFTASETERWSY